MSCPFTEIKIPYLRNLLEVTEADKVKVCEELEITLNGFNELVQMIKDYVDQSAHLPKDYETINIVGAIINNKANIQAAKKFIENYFRCKNTYGVIYDHCLPSSTNYKQSRKYTINVCTKKLTPQGNRVQIFKLCDPECHAENAFIYIIMLAMMCEIRGTYDFWASTLVIVDAEHFTYKHLLKCNMHWVFAVKDIMETIHFRIQGFHVVNGPPVIEKFLDLARAILPAKLKQRVYIHKNYESLHEVVPKDSLPEDYGGSDKPLGQLREEWNNAFDNLQPFFQKLRDAKSTKMYELSETETKDLGLGLEGTFKKLNID